MKNVHFETFTSMLRKRLEIEDVANVVRKSRLGIRLGISMQKYDSVNSSKQKKTKRTYKTYNK